MDFVVWPKLHEALATKMVAAIASCRHMRFSPRTGPLQASH
jgi:hypothetical protein